MLSSGQQKIVSYFENAVKSDGARHAYLLKGSRGVGKKYISRIAELYFACHHGSACKMCNGCKSALVGANFDIIRLTPNEKKRYEVATVRDLIKRVYEKPMGGKYKIITIEDMHIMEPVCQNALLKIIEEPPAYAVFVLICDNVSSVLPTILSRVTPVELLPWSMDELKELVPLEAGDEFLYNYCMGSPGVLISLSEDDEFKTSRNTAIDSLAKVLKRESLTAVFDATSRVCESKEHIKALLEAMTVFLRDILFLKKGLSSQIVNIDKIEQIKNISQKITAQSCLRMIDICGSMPLNMKNNENVSMQIQGMFTQLEKALCDIH